MGTQSLMGAELQVGEMKMFWSWMVVTAARACECMSCHLTGHLKMTKVVNFMLRVLQQ